VSVFTIASETRRTSSILKDLYNFLADFKNFKAILPEDKVENFSHTPAECSFQIKGITPMKITVIDKKPYEYLLFESDGLAKFNFKLKASFMGEAEQPGECRVDLEGDLNPFIRSMVEKSLVALVNTMCTRLSAMEISHFKS
jgi:hypothetical protein